MRYLKPFKPRIEINGIEFELVFSLDVIDRIQDRTNMSIIEVVLMLTEERTSKLAAQVMIKYLTGQLIDIEDNKLDNYSTLLLNTYIEQSKFKDIPGLHRQEVSNGEYEPIDIEYWVYIGTVVLKMSEEMVWNITIGKLRTLHNEHAKYNGWIKEEKEQSLLNL